MKIQPHKYQIGAVHHCIENDKAALFLDMGLGKTVIVLTAFKNLLKNKKTKGILIIAPLRVVYNVWPQEIKKWDHLRELSFGILHGPDKDKVLKQKHDVYITNYESIKWLYTKLRRKPHSKIPFDMVAIDESTAIKSRTTKRFSMLRSMSPIFKRRIIMTGTPAPNSLLDLWAQYFFLDQGARLYGSWYTFRDKYFYQADYHGYEWEPVLKATAKISKRVQDITIRLRAEDYLDMPEKVLYDITCTMPKKVKQQYQFLESEFILHCQEGTVTAANAAVLSNKLRQFVAGRMYDEDGGIVNIHNEKLEALGEAVESNADEPLLIAIQFRYEYEMIKKVLPNVPVIYGGVGVKRSNRLIKQWCEGKLPQLVVHPLSIAHGVNLQTGGRRLIWYSIPWSFEQYYQLIGRLYRQGQPKPVMIGHIILKDSIDLRVLKVLQRKEETEESFLKLFVRDIRKTK